MLRQNPMTNDHIKKGWVQRILSRSWCDPKKERSRDLCQSSKAGPPGHFDIEQFRCSQPPLPCRCCTIRACSRNWYLFYYLIRQYHHDLAASSRLAFFIWIWINLSSSRQSKPHHWHDAGLFLHDRTDAPSVLHDLVSRSRHTNIARMIITKVHALEAAKGSFSKWPLKTWDASTSELSSINNDWIMLTVVRSSTPLKQAGVSMQIHNIQAIQAIWIRIRGWCNKQGCADQIYNSDTFTSENSKSKGPPDSNEAKFSSYHTWLIEVAYFSPIMVVMVAAGSGVTHHVLIEQDQWKSAPIIRDLNQQKLKLRILHAWMHHCISSHTFKGPRLYQKVPRKPSFPLNSIEWCPVVCPYSHRRIE